MPLRLRLSEFLQSRAMKANGMCNSDIDQGAILANECVQRLLLDPMQPDEGWWGTWARMVFNVSRDNPYITAPRGVTRITVIDVCKRPMQIFNQWAEYLDFGNGMRGGCGGACGSPAAFQRGDTGGTVVTAFDFKPPNKIIRVYITNAADIGKHILIQGKDQFGAPVTSTDGTNQFSGEFLTFAQPFAEGSEELSELTGLQKDVTQGQVQVFEIDTNTQEQRLLTIMEGGEEVASYHRIYLHGLPCNCGNGTGQVQVEAMVKLDFVPAKVTTDYLGISNLPALIEESQCIRFEGMDSSSAKQMAAFHHQRALSFLAGELDAHVGKQRVSVGLKLWGSDRMRLQSV